jgi:hypothetical protein
MKRKTKLALINISILVILIFVVYFGFFHKPSGTEESVARCIGEKSTLYVQIGCSACARQEEMFGKEIKYIKLVDCIYETEKCSIAGITHTPTWVINGEKYVGVQSIDKLKELTSC